MNCNISQKTDLKDQSLIWRWFGGHACSCFAYHDDDTTTHHAVWKAIRHFWNCPHWFKRDSKPN